MPKFVHKDEALKAAEALRVAAFALNAADGDLAIERPATVFSKVTNALKGVFEALAVEDGYVGRRAQDIVDLAWQSVLDGNDAAYSYDIAIANYAAIEAALKKEGWA
jgi:hypothetical protein